MSSLKKIYLVIAGTGIVLVLLVFFLILPLVNKIEDSSKKYTDGQVMLFQIQQKELLLKAQEKLFEKTQAKFSEVEKSFLKSEDLVNFIASLEKIAEENKAQFEIKAVSPPEEGKQYYTFTIFVKSAFSDLLRFLFALENTPGLPYRLIEIKDITIKGIKPQESEKVKAIKVEGNLEIRVYTDI